MEQWRRHTECTATDLKSILGKLFFIASCSRTLRLFTNRMLATLRGARKSNTISLDIDFHRDVEWIDCFLSKFKGINFIPRSPTYNVPLVVDSCLTGCGAHLGNMWYSEVFPECVLSKQLSISQLKMINTMVAVKTLTTNIRDHVLLLKCDNSVSVTVLQNG